MRILFLGSVKSGQTSRMRMDVLRDLGHRVTPVDTQRRWDSAGRVVRKLQQLSCAGPIISGINRDVVRAAQTEVPDLIWAEKQEYLAPDTLRELRRRGATLLHFTPDPYFSLAWKRTRLMDDSLALFDHLVTSKRYELADYRRIGPNVLYTPLGFSETVHRPKSPSSEKHAAKFASDVSFLGGWEPRRELALSLLARIDGIRLKIWGYGWDHLADGRMTPRRWLAVRRNAGTIRWQMTRDSELARCIQGPEVYADEYAWALSGARIGIGFLRTICPDQHTTRTFEIPACGSMLLADRTDEHLEFFREGEEAEFFDSFAELIEKLKYYLANETARARIAAAGFLRCHASGYSYRTLVESIMRQVS